MGCCRGRMKTSQLLPFVLLALVLFSFVMVSIRPEHQLDMGPQFKRSNMRGSRGSRGSRGTRTSPIQNLQIRLKPGGSAELTYEAERANMEGAHVSSDGSGYSGSGYVVMYGSEVGYLAWTVGLHQAGDYIISIQYASGSTMPHPVQLRVNGKLCKEYVWKNTGGFHNFKSSEGARCTLLNGFNGVRITAPGPSGLNVDYLRVVHVEEAAVATAPSIKEPEAVHEYNTLAWMVPRMKDYPLLTLSPSYRVEADHEPPIVPEMLYWRQTPQQGREAFPGFEKLQPGKYLTFETDEGGFNNIRLAFQYFVRTAALSGRTLVLPVDCGWYLLDWSSTFTYKTVSTYDMFWDIEDLRRAVPVMDFDEFVTKETERLGIPAGLDIINSKANKCVDMDTSQKTTAASSAVGWIRDHSIRDKRPDANYLSYKDEPILHCPEIRGQNGWRYLFGWASPQASIPDKVRKEDQWRLQRNHMHLRPEIAYLASRIVRALGGPFSFSAAHIRRGDFQYHDKKVPDAQSYQNIKGLLHQNETVYVSTDEDPSFFQAMRKEHPLHVRGDFDELFADVTIDPKLAGMVEQMVCSMGRIFIGTQLSTFTGGIYQMRYFNDLVENQAEYWHNEQTGGLRRRLLSQDQLLEGALDTDQHFVDVEPVSAPDNQQVNSRAN